MVARWSAGSTVTAAVAVLILASGCGGPSKPATGGGASGPTGTSQSSSTGQPAAPLTKAQLTAALLTAKDLPAGYKTGPSSNDDADALTGDANCQKMTATDLALGKGTGTGQVAYAAVSFTTADNTGGGDESLSSFMTQTAAKNEFSAYAAAADSCRSLGLKVDPATNTTIRLTPTPLSLPVVGDESHAYQYLGTLQGRTFWLDAMVFRAGSTLALLSAGGLGSAPDSGLLQQIANKAVGKLT